jgi:anti-sigma factor (TIGR02949 family)
MKEVQEEECACDQIRRHLDSYISHESTPERDQQILRHVENCSACAAELQIRTRFREQLKAAVERQYVPRDLQARVIERIHDGRSRPWWTASWNRWATAVAASVALAFVVWLNYSPTRMPALSDRPAQDAYIQKVSASLMPVLKIGLRDHIHCSIFRKYPKNPPTVAQMIDELGPSYKHLVNLTKATVPDRYRVIMAHRCGYAARKYIHLTLENNGELISLVITRKNTGESLNGIAPVLSASGLPVYQSAAERYQVAAFDSGQYLAFIVSELPGKANLQIAAKLAPTVHEFLTRMPA